MYPQGLIIKMNAVIFGVEYFTWLREKITDNTQWWVLLLSEVFFFCSSGSCFILKWNSSVTFIHYLMFMHVECFILLNANPLLCLIERPFETFSQAPSFVLRATRHSWIFHFLMRLLPVITQLCSPRTYNYRRYTLCLRHTHTLVHTSSVTRARILVCTPSNIRTHANPGRLFIY